MNHPKHLFAEPRKSPDHPVCTAAHKILDSAPMPCIKVSTNIEYDFGVWICFDHLSGEAAACSIGDSDGMSQ